MYGLMMFVLVLVAGACNQKGEPHLDPMERLPQTAWLLVSLEGVENTAETFGEQLPFLEFEPDGTFGGYAGCNKMAGAKLTLGATLSISPGMLTRMACPGDGEMKFLNALHSADGLIVTQYKAIFSKGGKVIITFMST